MTKIVNILLQRSDQNCPWGFQLMGGKDYGTVVTIRKTVKGTLAASYLTAGDVVLFVGRCDTRLSTLEELNAVILKSSNRLELTVLKMLNDVICYPY